MSMVHVWVLRASATNLKLNDLYMADNYSTFVLVNRTHKEEEEEEKCICDVNKRYK